MSEEFQFEKKWKDKFVKGEELKDSDLQSISSGSLKLDWALGKPFVEGSIVELYGEHGTGKTTCALEVAANAHKLSKHVFYIDIERKLREAQLEMISELDRSKITVLYPDTGEEAGNMMEEFVRSVPGCVVILDSVSALLPEAEDAENVGKQFMGNVAKLCAQIIRKITGPAARNKCLIIFINHVTSTMSMYGPSKTVKGGRAIGDRASQRVELVTVKSELIQGNKGDIVGQNIRCKVVKNNMGRPYLTADVPILYGHGIYKSLDLFNFARDVGVLEQPSKGWFKLDDKNVRQSQVMAKLEEDNEFRLDIESRIKELYQ